MRSARSYALIPGLIPGVILLFFGVGYAFGRLFL